MPYEQTILTILTSDNITVMLLILTILVAAILLLSWWFTRSQSRTLKVVEKQVDNHGRMIGTLEKQQQSVTSIQGTVEKNLGILLDHDRNAVTRHSDVIERLARLNSALTLISTDVKNILKELGNEAKPVEHPVNVSVVLPAVDDSTAGPGTGYPANTD